jgi:CheY-like chemotaxis protein
MKATVLVVDDDPIIRKRLCTQLESEGFRTLVAGNGREALGVLEDHRPSLILVDLEMPVMDGWKLVQALRCYEELAAIPLVLMADRDHPTAHLRELPVVRKPSDPAAAQEAVAFTLQRLATAHAA